MRKIGLNICGFVSVTPVEQKLDLELAQGCTNVNTTLSSLLIGTHRYVPNTTLQVYTDLKLKFKFEFG